MEKKIYVERLGDSKEWNLEKDWSFSKREPSLSNGLVPIDELLEFLSESKGNGAKYMDLSFRHDWGNDMDVDDVIFEPVIIRHETTEEFDIRLEKEQQDLNLREKFRKAGERRRYEELKAKFEKEDRG